MISSSVRISEIKCFKRKKTHQKPQKNQQQRKTG